MTQVLKGTEAEKFVAWLTMIKGFLPKSMPLSEAQEIYMRKRGEDKKRAHAFIRYLVIY
jgi:hypothetical protein